MLQKMLTRTSIAPLTLALFIGGCATSQSPSTQTVVGAASLDKPLYLIGSFNWWEVDEKYVFTEVTRGEYSTKVELIADGQPYDFIIADAKWSPGYTCGYRSKNTDRVLELNKSSDANCTSRTNNFQFKPTANGTYTVTINLSKEVPRVSLSQDS